MLGQLCKLSTLYPTSTTRQAWPACSHGCYTTMLSLHNLGQHLSAEQLH